MISLCRPSTRAARMRPPMSSSTSSQVTRSHWPSPRAPKRVEDAFGILHLVQGRGPLGAVSAAAARMLGVALELLDLEGLLVHVSEKPTGRLAVEADGRHQRVVPGHAARPGAGVELCPVAPAIDGGIAN